MTHADKVPTSVTREPTSAPEVGHFHCLFVHHFGIAPPPEIGAGQNFVKPVFSTPAPQDRVVSEVATAPVAVTPEPAGSEAAGQGDGQGNGQADASFELDTEG